MRIGLRSPSREAVMASTTPAAGGWAARGHVRPDVHSQAVSRRPGLLAASDEERHELSRGTHRHSSQVSPVPDDARASALVVVSRRSRASPGPRPELGPESIPDALVRSGVAGRAAFEVVDGPSRLLTRRNPRRRSFDRFTCMCDPRTFRSAAGAATSGCAARSAARGRPRFAKAQTRRHPLGQRLLSPPARSRRPCTGSSGFSVARSRSLACARRHEHDGAFRRLNELSTASLASRSGRLRFAST